MERADAPSENVLFTLIVPGAVSADVPYFLTDNRASASGVWLLVAAALFALGGAIYLSCVLLYEEQHLAKQFGAEYADYCTKANRWLPRIDFQ